MDDFVGFAAGRRSGAARAASFVGADDAVRELLRAAAYGRNSSNIAHSVRDQMKRHREAAPRHGLSVVAEFFDGESASRHATRARRGWPELLRMLPELDVVMLWEASRGDRTLGTWVAFLDRCRELGVRIFDTSRGKMLDPADARDYRGLAEDGVDAAYEADKISMRTSRGLQTAAQEGRPTGTVTYGYERVYHDRTGTFVAQREHPVHGPVVREIVQRLGAGEAMTAVARDLTTRGVATPEGAGTYVAEIARRHRRDEPAGRIAADLLRRRVLAMGPADAEAMVDEVIDRVAGLSRDRESAHVIAAELAERGVWAVLPGWQVTTVQRIALNRAYVGVRVHRPKRGEAREYPALWPAIVTEEEHHRAVRTLTAPNRRRTWTARPGRAHTLVGNIAVCATCGDRIGSKGGGIYRCCLQIQQAPVDTLVFEAIVATVSAPAMFRQLRQASDADDRDLVAAQAEVDRLHADLDGWRLSAARGKTSADSLAVIEADLSKQIRDAQRRAAKASTPPLVRDLLGDSAEQIQEAEVRRRLAAAPLGAQRDLVRTLMTVTIRPAPYRGAKATERVDIAWR